MKGSTSIILRMLLLLSHFSRVQLCMTPQTAAHQAPLSLGFSRQEHWSGLPFPSPMHQSEKWKWSRSVMSDSQRPHRLQPTRLLHPLNIGSREQCIYTWKHLCLSPSHSESETTGLLTKPWTGEAREHDSRCQHLWPKIINLDFPSLIQHQRCLF